MSQDIIQVDIYGHSTAVRVLRTYPAGTMDVERMTDGQCFRVTGLQPAKQEEVCGICHAEDAAGTCIECRTTACTDCLAEHTAAGACEFLPAGCCREHHKTHPK